MQCHAGTESALLDYILQTVPLDQVAMPAYIIQGIYVCDYRHVYVCRYVYLHQCVHIYLCTCKRVSQHNPLLLMQ